MISKQLFRQFRRENPIICATCFYYQQGKRDGHCYGVPPIAGKTISVYANRPACSLHQDNQEDIIKTMLMPDISTSILSGILISLLLKDNAK